MAKKKAEKKANPVGAPSKYRPEYCERMIEYFKEARLIFKKVNFARHGEKEYLEFPTFQGFAAFEIGVCHDTLKEWTKHYPEFSEAYKTCKSIQEQILVKGGLTKAYDSTFAKFILNAVSDNFKEKPVEVEMSKETQNMIRLGYALPDKKEE